VLAYNLPNKLAFAALQNKAGEFVTATTASGAATLAATQFPASLLRAWPSDPDGKDSYPIATFSGELDLKALEKVWFGLTVLHRVVVFKMRSNPVFGTEAQRLGLSLTSLLWRRPDEFLISSNTS
jgi:hypothetical protein